MLATIFSGTDDLIVIVVALVVIFGGSQLPKLAHNTGQALREFRKARTELEPEAAQGEATTGAGATGVAPAPIALSAGAQGNAGSQVQGSAETVTLTKEQFDALLAMRASDAAKTEGQGTQS